MARKKKPQVPSWVVKVCKMKPNRMSYRYCGCGQPILEQTDTIIEAYDIPLLHGSDQLVLAVILQVMLTRIRVNPFSMLTLRADPKLDQEEYYLQAHRCFHQPIGTAELPIPRKPVGSTWKKPVLTDSEFSQFTQKWQKRGDTHE